MSMYDELKKIEKELEGEEYTEGAIGYYYACDLVPDTGEINETIKEILIKNKVIGKEDNVELMRVENIVSDFEPISDEWHYSEQIKKRFLDIFSGADGYYSMTADGSYAACGYLWSTCRVLQKGDEIVLLEFYITD